MQAHIESLQQQIHEQKAAYGQLCVQMNDTIRDIQTGVPTATAVSDM